MRKGQGMDARLVHSDIVRRFDREFRSLSGSQLRAVRKSWGAMIRSRGSRAWLEAERRRLFGPFGAPRKVKGTRGGICSHFASCPSPRGSRIPSATLQSFLLKKQTPDPEKHRLFVLDESSLASTKQVNDFFKRLAPKDRVLLVGDAKQHQAVDAGRPFQQMQDAGMRTAHLEEIVRQRDPELKRAVESLAGRDGRRRETPGGAATHS